MSGIKLDKDWKYILVIVLLTATLTFFIIRSFNASGKLQVIKGRLEAYQEETAKEKEKLLAMVSEKEKQNIQLTKENVELEKQSVEKAGKILNLDKETASLKDELKQLTDKDEIIKKQGELIATLELTLKYEREDKAAIRIAYLNERTQKENLRQMYDSVSAQLQRQEALTKISLDLNKKYESQIKLLKFESKVKTWLIGGVVAYGGYRFYKGVLK